MKSQVFIALEITPEQVERRLEALRLASLPFPPVQRPGKVHVSQCRECGGSGYLYARGDRREISWPCDNCYI